MVIIAPVTRKGEGGNRRQTITKLREESKQREKGEDRRFAPNEDNWGCPLTKIVPRLGSSTFFGAPKIVLENFKEKN